MKTQSCRRTTQWALSLALAGCLLGLLGADSAAPEPSGFDAFRILIERNIFDSTRKPPSAVPAAGPTPPPPPPRQVLRLMGTYLRDGRSFALFEGTEEVPIEALEKGGAIAEYRIKEIRVRAVVLANAQGTLEIPVGAGLNKGEDGRWTIVDKPVVNQPNPDTAGNAESKPSADGSASGTQEASGDKAESEALERLRERRRKELGQ